MGLLTVSPNKAVSQTIPYSLTEFSEQLPTFPTVKKLRHKTIANYCSCVLFVKSQTGFNQTVGYAKNWPINSQVPQVGAVVVLQEGYAGHVALITSLTAETITVREANYIHCAVDTRTLNINHPDIKGYWINLW